MGVTESKCVNIAAAYEGAKYLVDSYSVIRTSGATEDGWMMTEKPHLCYNQDPRCSWRPRAHAFLEQVGWRVHLHNGDHEDAEGKVLASHSCGWRRLGTFWPTRLTGDQEAIDSWTATLKADLERFAADQGLPSEYYQHQCGMGAPPEYCDACCAERRAKEAKEKNITLAALRKQMAQIEEQQEVAERHDEMAALDSAWDDLDRQICALENEGEDADEVERDLYRVRGKLSWMRVMENPTPQQTARREELERQLVNLEEQWRLIQEWKAGGPGCD
jgi:hypothetical protein